MKRKKLLLLVLTLLTLSVNARADDFFTEEGIQYYYLDGNNVEIGLVTSDSKYELYTPADFVIPEKVTHGGVEYTVTRVGERLLTSWAYLTSITIPQTITHIGHNAFCGCSGLTAVYVYAIEPCILGSSADDVSSVFMHVDKENCTLYVPKDCVEKYRATEGWKDFFNIVEMGSTEIASIQKASAQPSVTYNLNGQRLENPAKGVFVINGKKVIIK